ncbi:DUF523 and DUF1722 domain-containing protein [Vibrio hannami]|uniref:YbgA family protein n=1 Tax=Vibrio hannami TaxID=2717094 RepID=UPI00240F0FB7|nr:DUF523 and DUF1722 domain-containing protein [Vibrio hannami]MDG3086135.1 DUF523 and DUF1722 domain-containing protein [Vibrio hannami]
MKDQIKIGISACVLGQKVRFDSGHKESRFVTQELADYFSFVPVCPEVGIGLPVPRPTIRLISDDERVALVETKDTSKDYTSDMISYSKDKVAQLNNEQLCGYIVCAKSPTCGMERVKIYKKNRADKNGVGLFTRELMNKMPWLPVEEDGRLNDPYLKENFVTRIYCLNDFYQSVGEEPTAGKIIAFHSRYKLTLMAHHPQSYKTLGQLVANVSKYSLEEFYQQYRLGLMEAMRHRASRKNNTNVLMHIQGYFKKKISKEERQELATIIQDYRKGVLPILAPITLIKHYLNRYPNNYLGQQNYLEPYPQDLRLRYAL